MWLGDYAEDFTAVVCMFTTHASTGAPVAPSTAFEAADVRIYKNGDAAEKSTTNGVTMTSPFDSITGLHCITIDTSVDTGDIGFWATGNVYTLVLSPDETVDSVAVAKVIGQFGIELPNVLRPTTAGRKLDVTTGGEAGIDWGNVGSNSATVNLSNTTIATIGTNGINSSSFATGAITASSIATDAITSAELSATGVDEIVDAVWDEVLTQGTHNVNQSAGRRLREIGSSVIYSGTAASATINTITLDAGASSTSGTYDPATIRISGGTGAGQSRTILDYNGSTKVAVVDRDWRTTPDATSTFEIVSAGNLASTNEGLARGGTANTITLNTDASSTAGAYVGTTVVLRTGTGQDQSRIVTAYNGTTKVATVAQNWDVTPTTSTGYMVFPTGRTMLATCVSGAITASAFAADAIDAAALASSAVTEIQTGLATGGDLTTIDANVDAIKLQTDKLTFDGANMVAADMQKISTSATAADNLERGALALVLNTCGAGSTTTSVVTNLTETTNDHYNGRVITFTTGALTGETTSISDYDGASKTLTVVALTEAPAENDEFVIS